MCNLYVPPSYEKLNRPDLKDLYGGYVAPLKPGPYFTAQEIVVGQWGMIRPGSPTRKPQGQTNNARRETICKLPTYKKAWETGQRCLIPAITFDEPYYPDTDIRTKSINWQFARADGEPWMLAGFWSEWQDPQTGEIVPNYTMITQNCDAHPLFKLMHKLERDNEGNLLPPDKQDKRAVVPLERNKWDEWFNGSQDQADKLIVLPPLEVFRHRASDGAKNIPLPGIAHQTQVATDAPGLF